MVLASGSLWGKDIKRTFEAGVCFSCFLSSESRAVSGWPQIWTHSPEVLACMVCRENYLSNDNTHNNMNPIQYHTGLHQKLKYWIYSVRVLADLELVIMSYFFLNRSAFWLKLFSVTGQMHLLHIIVASKCWFHVSCWCWMRVHIHTHTYIYILFHLFVYVLIDLFIYL